MIDTQKLAEEIAETVSANLTMYETTDGWEVLVKEIKEKLDEKLCQK